MPAQPTLQPQQENCPGVPCNFGVPTGHKMGLRTYAIEKSPEGENAHVRRRRYLNVGLDSHSRLFGEDNDGNTFRTKPNYMKSDILGTGDESVSYHQKRVDDNQHDDQPDSNGNGNGTFEHEHDQSGAEATDEQSQHGDGETETDAGSTVAETERVVEVSFTGDAEISTPGNKTSTPPAAAARDGGGIGGFSYREVEAETPHRRRQYGNRQNARSGFW